MHRDVEGVVRVWLLVALAACSSKKSQQQQPPAPPPVAKPDAAAAFPRPTMKASQPIDLPDVGITALQIVPTVSVDSNGSARADKGVFDLEWREPYRHGTAVVCRIESYNLAHFGDLDVPEDAKPGQHEVPYTPDPFVLDPKVCEARFLDGRHDVIARACYQDGTMTAGACPPGTFPPPKLPAGMAVDVQGASVHTFGDGLQVVALLTVGQPVETPSFAVRCDGVDSVPDPSEGLVPVRRLAAGETLYTWQLIVRMQQRFASAPKQCELRVFDKGKTLGTFCIAEGSTNPGRCGT